MIYVGINEIPDTSENEQVACGDMPGEVALMPIYEYQCGACGHQLEKLQKLNDAPLVNCPSCSEDELKKMISAAGFRLKGGGWYETDFKTGSKKNLVGDKASGGSSKASAGASKKNSIAESATSSKKSA